MDRLQQIAPDGVADPPAGPADPALSAAIATLPSELRECLALRYYADLSLEDIARAQEIPVGTVKSRLHGAAKKLRETLKQAGYERDA